MLRRPPLLRSRAHENGSATPGGSAQREAARLADDPLVAALGSAEPDVCERAKAALVARGSEAVPYLLYCLEAEGDGRRMRALSLLALLGDARAVAPVMSLLRHSDAALRARAAGALARIASPGTIAALAHLLHRDDQHAVRLSAARSLVRLVQTGHDEALRPLLQLIADPVEDARVRVAAMDAIAWAMPSGAETGGAGECAIRGLLLRLAADGTLHVAQKAKRLLGSPARPRLDRWAIEKLIADLRSDRLSVWRRAISRLGRSGSEVVEPLLEAMVRAPEDAELARRAVLALKGLSARSLARIGPYLDERTARIPLHALLEVAAEAGSRALLARIAALIRRLADGPEAEGPDALDGVRQFAHRALARHGSRLAIDDLRKLLEDRRYLVRPDLAEAAALVGTRRDLPALLRGYRRSRGVARLALRDAVLRMCRREKIRRTDRCLTLLEPAEQAAAAEILGAARPAKPRRRMSPIDRVSSPLLV